MSRRKRLKRKSNRNVSHLDVLCNFLVKYDLDLVCCKIFKNLLAVWSIIWTTLWVSKSSFVFDILNYQGISALGFTMVVCLMLSFCIVFLPLMYVKVLLSMRDEMYKEEKALKEQVY